MVELPLPTMGTGGVLARVRSVAAAGGLLFGLSLAGCGDGSSATARSSAAPSTSQASRWTSSTAPSSTTPEATGEHAVDPPGPFRAPLHTADLLISRLHPLSGRMVRLISHVAGVTRVEQFSMAQVSVEDHAINVAAVDPATYRSFNLGEVAQFQPEWNRIAGGEMALRKTFSRQVGQDGYVRLGAGSDAPRVHVGVYSSQVPGVDAVVNESWVSTLGMRPGNALLVSTGTRTPQTIRKPIQRIVGDRASVQRLDVAARLGLDPQAVQTAFLVGSAADAVGSYSYSVLGGGRIAPQPGWVDGHVSTETMPILGAMTCNTEMFPQLRAALDEIV